MADARYEDNATAQAERFAPPMVDVFRTMTTPGEDVAVPDVPEIIERLLDSGIELDDPDVMLALPSNAFVAFAFWSRQPDFEQAASAVLRGQEQYVKVIRDGMWNRVMTWLNDFDVVDRRPSAQGARIAIGEVHIPHVAGCVGTFATTRSGTLDVSIKVTGLSGGRSKRITLSSEVAVPGVCRALTTGIAYEMTIKKHRFNGQLIALCKMLWIDGSVVDEQLPAGEHHPCSNNYQTAKTRIPNIAAAAGLEAGIDYSDLPLRQSVALDPKFKMSLETGTVYSALVTTPGGTLKGITIPSIELKVESTVTETVEISWKLVPGHDYLRFRSERQDMRVFWAWG